MVYIKNLEVNILFVTEIQQSIFQDLRKCFFSSQIHDKMWSLLHSLGRYQLYVHSIAQNTSCNGRYGTFCYECILCVPSLMGHITRTICWYKSKYNYFIFYLYIIYKLFNEIRYTISKNTVELSNKEDNISIRV